jgi:DNA polymerase-3 subunit alpha
MQPRFIHLRLHSEFSLVDGIVKIKPLVKRLAELNMPAVAITDHVNLFSLVKFYKTAIGQGIKPIAGADVLLLNPEDPATPYRLTLLVNNHRGYITLTELISRAYQHGQYQGVPLLQREWLEDNHYGLLALSGGLQGDIGKALLLGNLEQARKLASYWSDLFPQSFYLELQRVGKPDEELYIGGAIELALETGLPVVATNDVRFLDAKDFAAHEVRVCINQSRTLDDPRRPKDYTEQQYLRSSEEMAQLFADIPEALANSVEIAKRCSLTLTLGKNFLPDYPVPEGMTLSDVMRLQSEQGLEERLAKHGATGSGTEAENRQVYIDRLNFELNMISQMGFPGYFMIVADFIQWAKNHDIPVGPGRGSGAGSLVAYALKITDLDPIEFELLFERFLNPERISMPDFDIDFCMDRRDEVIDYVAEHYGRDHVAQIITYGSMAAKAVVRDVGRVLGFGYGFVDRLAKLIPFEIGMTLVKALKDSPELKQLYDTDEEVKTLIDMALTLEGTARNAGKHAGGVVISPTKLTDFTPLYCEQDGSNLVTQFDKSDVESVGLVKFDFLGLRTLTIIDWALQTINAKQKLLNKDLVDISAIPRDDTATYELLKRGDTTAVFQLESRGMKELIKKLKPDCFNDIIALVALFRPGPLESGMVDDYVNVKHKIQKAEYAHPLLEPILEPTNGVILYQEQVMQIARELSGYSLGGADILRRAMGKKDAAEMARQRDTFVSGALKNNVSEDISNYIFDLIDKFAGYGFNKCITGDTLIANAQTGELKSVSDWYSLGLSTVISLQADYQLNTSAVVTLMENGIKPVFKLTTSLGKTITATANHPFLTVNGWKNLEELAINERICSPAYLPIEGQQQWADYQLITLGWILSEGNTCHPSGFYFYNNNTLAVADFSNAVNQFNNTVARSYQRADRKGIYEVYVGTGQDGKIQAGEQRNTLERSGARLWLESLALINIKAPQKKLPDSVFQLTNHCLAILIGRLWSGDGFIAGKNNTTPYFASSSKKLVTQLQHLLLRFRIVTKIQKKYFAYKEGRIGYTLHVLGRRSIHAFIEYISAHLIGKDEQLLFLTNYLHAVGENLESIDTLPAELHAIVREEKQKTNLTWLKLEQKTGICTREFYGELKKHKKGFRRSTIIKLAEFFNSERLYKIAHEDLFWERIISIEAVGEQLTYDLEINDTHNFIANDIIVHNSHSAAYALVAYQTAWLKTHYSAAFMAAVLSSDMDNTDKVVILIEECKVMKLTVLPPLINSSNYHFTVNDKEQIIYGLGALKGAGEAALEELIAERNTNGAFTGLYDLCKRVDTRKVNKRVLEALCKAGAFDEFDTNRAAHLDELTTALKIAEQHGKMAAAGQNDLFGLSSQSDELIETDNNTYTSNIAPWTTKERLEAEKTILGLYLSGHPIDSYKQELQYFIPKTINTLLAELQPSRRANTVRLAGLAIDIGIRQNKQGKLRGFALLDDNTGRIEISAYREAFENNQALFNKDYKDTVLIAEGQLAIDEYLNMPLLKLDKLYTFEQARSFFVRAIEISWALKQQTLPVKQLMQQLNSILTEFKQGNTPIIIHYSAKTAKATIHLADNWRVLPSDELIKQLKALLGESAVLMRYK